MATAKGRVGLPSKTTNKKTSTSKKVSGDITKNPLVFDTPAYQQQFGGQTGTGLTKAVSAYRKENPELVSQATDFSNYLKDIGTIGIKEAQQKYPQIQLPPPPTQPNVPPVSVTNVGFGADATTGMFPVVTPTATPEAQQTPTLAEQLKQYGFPEQPESQLDVFTKAQRRFDIAEKEQAVNDLQSQLNMLVARSNAQQLSLEGQGRGQTTQFLGGEQARIQRESAIAALPLQAQLSAAQGNLETATKLMEQYVTLATADATNRYNYKMKLFETVYSIASDAQKERIAEKKTKADQDFQREMEQIRFNNDLILKKTPTYQESLSGTVGGLSSISQSVIDNPSLFFTFTPTKRAEIISELQSNGYDTSGLQNTKLSTSQEEDLSSMDTVSSLVDKTLLYKQGEELPGIGYGLGTIKGIASQLGFGEEDARTVRATIGNIKGTIAKLRGGTSFTPNEEKLLNSYTPSLNDSSAVAINKLANLKDFIASKKESLLNIKKLNPSLGQITKNDGVVAPEDLRAKYNY